MDSIQSEFLVSPCTPSDIPSMITVYERAFSSDYFGSFVFPSSSIPPAIKHAWLQNRLLKQFAKPEVRSFKITEASTGNVAAWIRWVYPHVLSPEEKEQRQKESDRMEREGESEWPEGSNQELIKAKFGGIETFRAKHVKGDITYAINLLATDPAYQRRGLASKLLKHGLDLADAEGRPAYLEATKAGYPVYLKLGFRDVDVLEVDLSKWGGKEMGRNIIMIREPLSK